MIKVKLNRSLTRTGSLLGKGPLWVRLCENV